jgi:Glutamine amidotransferase domain
MTRALALLAAQSSDETTPSVKTVDLPRPQVPVELERVGPGGRRLWIDGLPITLEGNLDRVLAAAVDGGDLASARRTLTSLEGAFSAFLWDPRERRLVVVNDIAGVQPLYMRRTTGGVMFAPRIEALAGDARPDPTGWGAFVGLGCFVGDRTSVDGVTRVPPATVVEYDAVSDRVSFTTYWQWPAANPDLTLDRVDTGALLSVLDASLRAYDVYDHVPPLLLSGGFESRLTAALLVRAGRPPTALTLRNPYEHLEIDGRFAARVARQLRLSHVVRDPDPHFFSTPKYLEYVRQHEVASTSVNLFIAQIASELQAAGIESSWDGFAFGSIVKSKSDETFDAFLQKMIKPADGPAWQAARQIFSADFVDAMFQGMRSAVQREIEVCHPAPHGTQQFFQRNRIRHRIAPNTLKVYSTFLLPYLPGIHRAYYDRVVPIPTSMRRHEALYRCIFERHFPSLARLPWSSGGHLTPGTHVGAGYRALAARSALVEHPRVGNMLRRLGLTPSRSLPRFVSEAVQRASLDDRCLNADGIRALQHTPPTGSNADTFARELVFYWSMWREIMTGSPRAAARCQA